MSRVSPVQLLPASLALLLSACSLGPARTPGIDPDTARAQIEARLPAKLEGRAGWAVDIHAAFEALRIEPAPRNTCAVVAVIAQESSFRADPTVAGLPAIARREIETRAASHHVPMVLVNAALALRSPDGRTYRARLDAAKTERELSDIFEDFVGMVPLGRRLFADWNPVRTGGSMQVSIAFAEQHAARKPYPYPHDGSLRREVFTRRGGLYFGIAHLLDYEAPYDAMGYRFADFNAGHYASRNAAFQAAVRKLAGVALVLDGDLGSATEAAVRRIGSRLEVSEARIHEDLARGNDADFERTRTYASVFALADAPRAHEHMASNEGFGKIVLSC